MTEGNTARSLEPADAGRGSTSALEWADVAGKVAGPSARPDADRAERHATFLAEAGLRLTSSLEPETIFARAAALAVPVLADWCVVDACRDDGTLERVAAAHADGTDAVRELARPRSTRLGQGAGQPIADVLRHGRSLLAAEVSPALLDAMAGEGPRRAALERVGLRSLIVVLLPSRDRPAGALTLAVAEGGRRFGPADLALAEALGRRVALALDNARVYAASERARRAAQGLAGLARLISSSLEPDEVARRIAESVRTLLHSRAAAVLRLDAAGELRVAATAGEGGLAGAPSFANDAAVVLAMRERQPVATPDVTADPRFGRRPPVLRPDGTPAHAVLAVPLVAKGEVTGILCIADTAGRRFGPEAIELAQVFADHAAIAQENSRLYAQAEELATARERVRVATELHDALSQVLFSIGLKLDWCLQHLPARPHRGVRPRLGEIRSEVGFVMEQIRGLIGELSPREERELFPAGLEALVEQFRSLTGTPVDLHVEGDVTRLEPARQQVLRKVLQEALTNVAKHARASWARVTLEVAADEARFEVVDDGVGPGAEASGVDVGHFGLRQMRERLEALGGRLAHDRCVPSGFRLAGTLPLTGAARP